MKKQHYLKTLSNKQDKIQEPDNCRNKENCTLNGKCLYQCMICKAEVTEYYETSDREREKERDRDRDRDRERVREIVRYSNHTRSFRHR